MILLIGHRNRSTSGGRLKQPFKRPHPRSVAKPQEQFRQKTGSRAGVSRAARCQG
jgi:hypothetical protein